MFDLRWIRDNPELFDQGIGRRGLAPASAEILKLDAERRTAQTALQEMQQRRNELSKRIGIAKGKGENADQLVAEVASLKDAMQSTEAKEQAAAAALDRLIESIPNLPAADIPDGADETANVELRKVGRPPELGFPARQHFKIGEGVGLMDFDAAAKLSGARFVVLKGALARLERALAAFMLDLHTQEFGYTEVVPPYLEIGRAH